MKTFNCSACNIELEYPPTDKVFTRCGECKKQGRFQECKAPICERKAGILGYCKKHYGKVYRIKHKK